MARELKEPRDFGWLGPTGVATRIFGSGEGVASRRIILLLIALSSGLLFLVGLLAVRTTSSAVVVAPVLLIAGSVILAACRGRPWALRACMVVFILTIDASFRGTASSPTAFDAQAFVKMMVAGGVLVVGLANLPASMRYFRSVPAIALAVYLALAVASAAYAPEPMFTLIHAVSFVGLFLFTGALVARLSFRDIMTTALVVLGFHVLLALAFAPLGKVPPAWMISGDGGTVFRLQGFVGHPLRLADVASLGVLCAWVMWLQGWLQLRLLVVVLALGAATLVLAHERMPVAACLLALMSLGRYRPLAAWCVLGLVIAGLFSAMFAPAIINGLAAAVSRGGGAEEIFTLTGRVEVWRQSLLIAADRPFFGYGFSSAVHVFAERYHVARGYALPTGAEGTLPQSLIGLGVIGTAFLVVTLISMLAFSIRNRDSMLNPFICYMFFTGITTSNAIGRSVNGATLFWMLAICLIATAVRSPARSNHVRFPAPRPLISAGAASD